MRAIRLVLEGTLVLAVAVLLLMLAGWVFLLASDPARARTANAAADFAYASAQARIQIEQVHSYWQQQQIAQSAALAMQAEQALAPIKVVAWGSLWLAIPAGLGLLFAAAANALWQQRVPLVYADRAGLLPVQRSQVGGLTSSAMWLLEQHHEQRRLQVVAAGLKQDVPQTLTYAPHFSSRIQGTREELMLQDSPGQTIALPTAPALADMLAQGWQPSMERFILGYANEGPVWGSIDDLLSTLVVGRPGTGKTTLLRCLLAQLVGVGAEVAILDPHGGLADLADVPVAWRAESSAQIDEVARELLGELDTRLTARRGGAREFRPLLVLVDEWNILSEISANAVAAARRYILEARKVRGYAVLSGQGAPASSFGGSVARDGLSSRYILWTSQRQAQMAGLERESHALLTQLGEGPKGRAILARSSAEPVLVAIPQTTAGDLMTLAGTAEAAEVREAVAAKRNQGAFSHFSPATSATSATSDPPPQAEPDKQEAVIVSMLKAGKSQNEIILEMYGVRGGRRYQQAAAQVSAVIAKHIA
jgi:hypothetical protein